MAPPESWSLKPAPGSTPSPSPPSHPASNPQVLPAAKHPHTHLLSAASPQLGPPLGVAGMTPSTSRAGLSSLPGTSAIHPRPRPTRLSYRHTGDVIPGSGSPLPSGWNSHISALVPNGGVSPQAHVLSAWPPAQLSPHTIPPTRHLFHLWGWGWGGIGRGTCRLPAPWHSLLDAPSLVPGPSPYHSAAPLCPVFLSKPPTGPQEPRKQEKYLPCLPTSSLSPPI